jgi:hypothetical protein
MPSSNDLEGQPEGPAEGALLKLEILETDDDGWVEGDDDGPELGPLDTLSDADGELEGPEDRSDEQVRKLGLLEGDDDDDGWVEKN